MYKNLSNPSKITKFKYEKLNSEYRDFFYFGKQKQVLLIIIK